jgi:hypothetical protein
MATLAEIRKNKSALMDKVNKALAGANTNADKKEDDRFWSPTRDASGNGTAIIRFLPPMADDELPWVKIFSRAFKVESTGKWYINNDLSTIGRDDDPVYQYIKPLYESGDEAKKKIAGTMKRKTHYISNILVIKDPANPANEGKVKLFKYGKKIYEMIMSKAQPTFDDEEKVYVYDIDSGANFRLRIKTVDGYPNYDSSVFDSVTPLCGGDDDEIQKVIDNYIPLAEFLDPKNFKSAEQLKKELDRALGNGAPIGKATDLLNEDKPAKKESKTEEAAPWDEEVKVPEKKTAKVEAKQEKAIVPSDDDDDDLALFKEMLGK